ncbi:hypothetical protein [Microbacterium lacticum]|uniref:hypothetical protein n=1 Tax=Microbacterium lacticum TaxID=33885 RepID=UPI0028D5B02C|nr:hypothetical protein [Microbacterium lacticum]
MPDSKLVRTKGKPDLAPVINIAARGRTVVGLVGEKYTVKAPKARLLLASTQAFQNVGTDLTKFDAAMEDVLRLIFDADDRQAVMDRLNDPDDLIDVQHVMELASALIAQASDLPK